jgi:hypothetical protein
LISNTSGIINSVTQYWIQEHVDDKSHLANDIRYMANFSTALSFLLLLGGNRAHLLLLIIDSAKGGETRVARLAILHAQTVFLCSKWDYDNSAVAHLKLIFNFIRQECPGLRFAMFKEGSVEAVIRILDIIASEESPGAVNMLALMICYKILCTAIEGAHSLTFIIQSLDAGLLQAMLCGGCHLMQPNIPSTIVKTALVCFDEWGSPGTQLS